MDSFRGRTIDLQVFLLSITVHLLSFPSFGWRTNVGLSCEPRKQAERRDGALRSVGACQLHWLVGRRSYRCTPSCPPQRMTPLEKTGLTIWGGGFGR